MRTFVLIFLLLACMSSLMAWTPLPSYYYRYQQISDLLSQYQTQYPNLAKKVQIGTTETDHLPIWALKISNNVQTEEDEPAVLLVGQVHAEEILGIQISMSNIKEILERSNQFPYNRWLQFMAIWFIPTANPEGLSVVMDPAAPDNSYRKNKKDANHDGIFNFDPRVGYDDDGVDPNRNFGFNWIHGDAYHQSEGVTEPYDYFRGEAPFSEAESRALRDFAYTYKPIYSIVWHSSRTGNLSEKVYFPFNWYDLRQNPDYALSQSIGTGIANTIMKESGTEAYGALPGTTSRKGAATEWFYKSIGCYQMLIECATRNLQPDSLIMADTVERCSNGVRWLLNRTLPQAYNTPVQEHSMLTGKITDVATGAGIEAEIIVKEKHADWFEPRLSNSTTGRFWRPISPGTYTIIIRKQGYQTLTVPGVVVFSSSWTTRNFSLQPLPASTIAGTVLYNGLPTAANIVFQQIDSTGVTTNNGEFSISAAADTCQVTITAPGAFPYVGGMRLSQGTHNLQVNLTTAQVLFSDDFESGLSNWQSSNDRWAIQNTNAYSGNALSDSWNTNPDSLGDIYYRVGCNAYIKSVQAITLPANLKSCLTFYHNLYTEWDYDTVRVEVSTDAQTWNTVWTKSGQYDWWHPEYISLDAYAGQAIYLRFRLTDDGANQYLVDPGWILDNISVIAGQPTTIVANDDPTQQPMLPPVLGQNYPNPFNPVTRIVFSTGSYSKQEAKIEIFNMKGQLVTTLPLYDSDKKQGSIEWNAKKQASGVYFYRLMVDGKQIDVKKAVLLK